MATIKKTVVEIEPARPAVTEEAYVLTLSKDEAGALRTLLGQTRAGGPLSGVYHALVQTGVLSYTYKIKVNDYGTITLEKR